jgi:hypothetical protein
LGRFSELVPLVPKFKNRPRGSSQRQRHQERNGGEENQRFGIRHQPHRQCTIWLGSAASPDTAMVVANTAVSSPPRGSTNSTSSGSSPNRPIRAASRAWARLAQHHAQCEPDAAGS